MTTIDKATEVLKSWLKTEKIELVDMNTNLSLDGIRRVETIREIATLLCDEVVVDWDNDTTSEWEVDTKLIERCKAAS